MHLVLLGQATGRRSRVGPVRLRLATKGTSSPMNHRPESPQVHPGGRQLRLLAKGPSTALHCRGGVLSVVLRAESSRSVLSPDSPEHKNAVPGLSILREAMHLRRQQPAGLIVGLVSACHSLHRLAHSVRAIVSSRSVSLTDWPANVSPLSRERRSLCYRLRPSRARRSSAAAAC